MAQLNPVTDETTARDAAAPSDAVPTSANVMRLPVADPDNDTRERMLLSVRRFHRSGITDDTALTPPTDDMLPALLHACRTPESIRTDYPLVLLPGGADGPLARPLAEVLRTALISSAPDSESARILRDNLDRLERHTMSVLTGTNQPMDVTAVLMDAGVLMIEALGLSPTSERELRNDLQQMVHAMPPGAALLGLGEHTALHLFIHIAVQRCTVRRSALRTEIDELRERLHDRLRTDRLNSPDGQAPDALERALGTGSSDLIDPARLSAVVGTTRGAEPMPDVMRQQLESVLATLGTYLDAPERPMLTIVGRPDDLLAEADTAVVLCPIDQAPTEAALRLFDEQATALSSVLGARRIARLYLAGEYEPARHDPLLESFDWTAFTDEERRLLPAMLVVDRHESLDGAGLASLSRLLRSTRPISVLVPVNPSMSPTETGAVRLELAALGISHRAAHVVQSSIARFDHLVSGFARSIDGTVAALHVIDPCPPRAGSLGPWLRGGSAIEGRAHPLFHFDPEAGITWARRVSFAGNPQPELDWPIGTIPVDESADGLTELTCAFTAADVALLEPELRDQFRVIPDGCDGDELRPLSDVLVLDQEDAQACLPFIWATDQSGALHRLIVSRGLVLSVQDRMAWWRSLQELAGIRNEYVLTAVAEERARLDAAFATAREQLIQEHNDAVEAVRHSAAGDTMQRLATALLAGDATSFAPALLGSPPTAPVSPTTVDPAADASAAPGTDSTVADAEPEATDTPAADSDEPIDPWIDSALCTTCNDCLDINAQLFVYNGNKQAVIGDATAGTFAQLVKAAEKCPAHCIHPGTPLDSNEPELESLIERALPFT